MRFCSWIAPAQGMLRKERATDLAIELKKRAKLDELCSRSCVQPLIFPLPLPPTAASHQQTLAHVVATPRTPAGSLGLPAPEQWPNRELVYHWSDEASPKSSHCILALSLWYCLLCSEYAARLQPVCSPQSAVCSVHERCAACVFLGATPRMRGS